MNEQTKPEANPEELTKEQLEGISGGDNAQVAPAPPPKEFLVLKLQEVFITGVIL